MISAIRSSIPTALLIAVVLLVGGCSSEMQLMPTPNLYARGEAEPFTDVSPELKNNHVEVLYLTDRQVEKPVDGQTTYGFKRSRSVAFGVCDVEIGKNITWEQLDAASRTSNRKVALPLRMVSTTEILRFPETPRILIELPPFPTGTTQPSTSATTLRSQVDLDKARAHEELARRLAKTPHKEVYIFVHGYNNTFEESVMVIGQMWHFLGRRGVPIAYSWPAGHTGLLRGYTYDRESSEFTVYHLKEMIRAIAGCEEVQKVNIICHSRGTGVVVSALAELIMEIGGSGKSTREVLKLGSVVLAAPDIDLDVMLQRAVTVRLGTVPEHTTIYVCAKDKALSLANWLFGGMTRLGAVRSDMFSPDELKVLRESQTVEIVDARISDPGPYGHSYFHANPAVSSDLILMMRYHLRPGENSRPLRLEKDSGFWIVDDDYPKQVKVPESTAAAMSGGG